ncbi:MULTISPECIES: hypothetical protein [unclassified Mesobacillus]|uniref:hypothetical protein n=1 Tax=unclassified Mesobacillus TaxID=2675270 RepID=UPI00203B8DE4|nr:MULTISPECIES: hypothetical protein [unclassified Mesobacillus]MCM3123011.1 hypothetical protein [Mesobacillus sp. MER 33]MCM3233506.1 hypothetical protein [Mesobacillus sp. MER 48]
MELVFSAITFVFIISTAGFIWKNRSERQGNGAIVGMILLSSSSVLVGLALKSIFSLIFYGLQLILLMMALGMAVKKQSKIDH